MNDSVLLETPVHTRHAIVNALDSIHEKVLLGQVEEGMNDLLPVLRSRRLAASDADWEQQVELCLAHPLRTILHQDPFTLRAFQKPRGYAGDAVLLDYIYGVEEGWGPPENTSDVGRTVFEFTTHSAACSAVRARRGFIADLLDRFVEETPKAHVLSLAAGHLREADLASCVRRRKLGRFVALDADGESLRVVERCYGRHGVEPVKARIRELLTARTNLGRFDLVYSTGLFDYLPQAAGQALARAMFQQLRPRGRMVLANFLPAVPDVGYMESYMGWKLIFRERLEMLDLVRAVPQEEIREVKIFAEENQNVIFLEVIRS